MGGGVKMIRFGPAGIPVSCESNNTVYGIECCHKVGLNAMEMEFVHGVKLKEKSAEEAKKVSEKFNVILSSHAPYYINLCSDDELKGKRSKHHIFESARITYLAGGRITVFHPGYYQNKSAEEAFAIAKKRIKEIEEKMKQYGIKCLLGAETVGKKKAFGGLKENIKLSQELEFVVPVIDFAHLQARGDFSFKKEADYLKLFELLEKELGDYMKNFHAHFSEIEYGEGGEKNHLTLGSNGIPPYKPLMKVLAENGYSGTIICETDKLEEDALIMKHAYEKYKKILK